MALLGVMLDVVTPSLTLEDEGAAMRSSQVANTPFFASLTMDLGAIIHVRTIQPHMCFSI